MSSAARARGPRPDEHLALGAAPADLAAEWFGGGYRRCEQSRAGREAAPTENGVWRKRRPESSPSPSTMPTCWCCRDDRAAMGSPGRPGHDARHPGLVAGNRPVPGRRAHGRRLGAGGRVRPGPADHLVLRLALEDRGSARVELRWDGGAAYYRCSPQRHTARLLWARPPGTATAVPPATSAAGCAAWRGSAQPVRCAGRPHLGLRPVWRARFGRSCAVALALMRRQRAPRCVERGPRRRPVPVGTLRSAAAPRPARRAPLSAGVAAIAPASALSLRPRSHVLIAARSAGATRRRPKFCACAARDAGRGAATSAHWGFARA